MKDWAKAFYNSNVWKDTRTAYKKSKNGLCEKCLAEGLITPAKIVHHKIWLTPDNINDPNITLNWSNLLCVCKSCHEEIHGNFTTKGTGKKKRYEVDQFGRVTSVS